MDSAIQLHSRYVDPVTNPPDFGIIKSIGFFNSYPDFKDTNNLSLVTILQYDGLGIIIPGDLETDGWLALLQRKDFRAELATINVFIASHHGRENGYCKEVFDYCQPDIFIISDKEIMHDTQKSLYGQHATGLPWDNGTTRYVLTTRSDGNIRLTKTIGQGYRITIGV